MGHFSRWLRSCIWLWVPPLVASFAFWPNLGAAYQPKEFWRDIPPLLGLVENVSRFVVIALSVVMLLEWRGSTQRVGLFVYAIGLSLYICCQWAIVADPTGAWATSAIGFLAPAYTPIIWVIGIGLIGSRPVYDRIPWRNSVFFGLAGVFLAAHNAHAWLVFSRLG
ncbi:hypothetical protein [uncultured Maritalea sp.]|uniref:hypothetical protein n=1 Tax=uncultured Maritalea sp. TaxID=757249 RepID=UPI0026130D82|nr:hypothetical protein [uncultured Maritalea sp.]